MASRRGDNFLKMEPGLKKNIDEFKQKIMKEAETAVMEHFPQTVLDLEELLESPELNPCDPKKILSDLLIPVPEPMVVNGLPSEEPDKKKRKVENSSTNVVEHLTGMKVYTLPSGSVPCNTNIRNLADKLKPIIRTLIDKCNLIKMWVQLLIPRIEDGNNFGVSIQEDTLAEIRQVESEVAGYLDQIHRYYITRGKLVSKVVKYPCLDDYRQSVKELDEKMWVSLRLICCEVRNNYSSLFDVITKNLEKIKKPRNHNVDTMY